MAKLLLKVVDNVMQWRGFYPTLRLLGAALISAILFRFDFFQLEGPLYDARTKLSLSPRISGQIVTIAVDGKSMGVLNGDPKVKDFSLVLDQLVEEKPKAVVFFFDPAKWEGSESDKLAFVEKSKGISNFFLATEQIVPASQNKFLKLSKPYDELLLTSAPITRDTVTFSEDKVTRRILISYEGQPLLQSQIAQLVTPIRSPESYRGSFESDGSQFTYIRYHPQGTYKPVSFTDARDGRFATGAMAGKIVLVGVDNEFDTDDYVLTPYSRYPLAMSRLEAQANIIDTLINDNGIKKAPTWLEFLLTLGMAALTMLVLWRAKPVNGIFILLAQTFSYSVIVYFIFSFAGVWITMTQPILASLVAYYFFIPYRLIMEHRKSWEYFQKNRILTQVEELKTNFLSMMSHDLKTPIARIQGMAELALTERANLSSPQKEALGSIISSSEELGQFIGSILDLSRIESKEVKLQKTSRDINTVLKEVIKKYDYHAKRKNITIVRNMDPLFSIKVDVDLIRQVFSNLVENAIKYSPEGTTVTISSREENGKVVVSVSDNGQGISHDDLENIFLKFYRSKDAKASPVKGSGLGLYLAKYFVDLHNGEILVDSTLNQGTTFTVQLPVG